MQLAKAISRQIHADDRRQRDFKKLKAQEAASDSIDVMGELRQLGAERLGRNRNLRLWFLLEDAA